MTQAEQVVFVQSMLSSLKSKCQHLNHAQLLQCIHVRCDSDSRGGTAQGAITSPLQPIPTAQAPPIQHGKSKTKINWTFSTPRPFKKQELGGNGPHFPCTQRLNRGKKQDGTITSEQRKSVHTHLFIETMLQNSQARNTSIPQTTVQISTKPAWFVYPQSSMVTNIYKLYTQLPNWGNYSMVQKLSWDECHSSNMRRVAWSCYTSLW